MKYQDYKETVPHGTFDFPIAYYWVDAQHPRYEMMLHWHLDYELIRVQEGVLHLELDGTPFTLQAGDVALVTDGVCHSGVPEDCVYECLVFDLGSFVAQNRIGSRQVMNILRHHQTVQPVLPKADKELTTVLEQLFAAMREPTDGCKLFVQGCLYQFLGFVIRDRLYDPSSHIARRNRSQQTSLKNAITYIEENYAGHVSLDDLARVAGMNRKYFCSFFHSMTHRTPVEYLNGYRVEQACEMLLHTDLTVAEIAGRCGFNDVSYFTKTFHRYMGITPLGCRKKRHPGKK